MANILIYPDTANILFEVIESFRSGDFDFGQLTLTDRLGAPVELVFQNDKEVEHE